MTGVGLLGTLHILFAIISLSVGLYVLLRPKGTRKHRFWGSVYVFSMLSLYGTTLSFYEPNATFGVLHVTAFMTLSALLIAYGSVLFKRGHPSFMMLHAYFMSWSFAGLISAVMGELLSRFSDMSIAYATVLAVIFMTVVGGVVIHLRLPPLLRRTGWMRPKEPKATKATRATKS